MVLVVFVWFCFVGCVNSHTYTNYMCAVLVLVQFIVLLQNTCLERHKVSQIISLRLGICFSLETCFDIILLVCLAPALVVSATPARLLSSLDSNIAILQNVILLTRFSCPYVEFTILVSRFVFH